MRTSLFLTTLLASIVSQDVQAYRVLILGALGTKSHKNIYMGIVDALVENGHHVTLVTGYPRSVSSSIANVREIVAPEGNIDLLQVNRFNNSMFSLMDQLTMYTSLCSNSLGNKKVQGLLKETFDVALLSAFFNDCYLSLVYQLQVPFIVVSPVGLVPNMAELLGNPHFSSFVTAPYFAHKHPLTFTQRLTNVLTDSISTYLFLNLFITNILENDCRARGLCPTEMPSFREMHRNASLSFVNSVKMLEDPARPYMPGVVHIGGIHCRPAKPLPKVNGIMKMYPIRSHVQVREAIEGVSKMANRKYGDVTVKSSYSEADLNRWVEGAGDAGFIFFSLGSAIKSGDVQENHRRILTKVFGSLKQRVLWKWDNDSMEGLPPNVRLGKWLPQQDILGHPKLRLFMTHGGLLSTLESVYHGTPVLSLPIFGDQKANAKDVERQGWGKVFLWEELKEEELLKGIHFLMNNEEMRQKVVSKSALMRDQPATPKSLAVFWTEYVVRHKGARHLRSPMLDMPLYKIYNMDVWLFLAAVSLLVLWIFYKILRLILSYIRRIFKSKID